MLPVGSTCANPGPVAWTIVTLTEIATALAGSAGRAEAGTVIVFPGPGLAPE